MLRQSKYQIPEHFIKRIIKMATIPQKMRRTLRLQSNQLVYIRNEIVKYRHKKQTLKLMNEPKTFPASCRAQIFEARYQSNGNKAVIATLQLTKQPGSFHLYAKAIVDNVTKNITRTSPAQQKRQLDFS